ncbi:hypothetical protein F5Y17DRAFT_432770 [Xylariaceae sp. FL0594]|nr:hypothetical protein F5Y17DRAFT_432770 [Xylariaceae sp. FL0594]
MATKLRMPNPLNGMHTAGIFSDMSIDGPEIGTLVLIVDRAKNLPNRKTIGKQDPYCAARLGKEAKKTTTDIRGGQTPKWDQELRFTVHESPDYFQLKLSVFNDDKKTELIGETWIDLRDIIVQGGGQSDQWHTLNCKGKYAGEIRIETTYYDSRPKLEKQTVKAKPISSVPEPESTRSGPRPQVKRRPLPSDPVTGQAPAPLPEPVNTPPRPQPNPANGLIPGQSPAQPIEYSTPPSGRRPQPDIHSNTHSPVYQYATPPPHRDSPHGRGSEKELSSYYGPPHEVDPFHQTDPAPPRPQKVENRAPYNPRHSNASQTSMQPRQSLEGRERPPPPPAHRVRNSFGHSPDTMHRGSYETVQHKATPPMRHDVLRNEAQRYSVSSASSPSTYPGRPQYRPYESAPALQSTPQHHDADRDLALQPRHYSYDSAYDHQDHQHRPLQPTVEDVPESWTPPQTISRGGFSQYEEQEFSSGGSPAPLNLNRREIAQHEHYNGSQAQVQPSYDNSMALEHRSSSEPLSRDPYGNDGTQAQYVPVQSRSQPLYDSYTENTSSSPQPPADYSQALTHVPRGQPYYQDNRYENQPTSVENQMYMPHEYGPAAVPPTLVPGIDPSRAVEATDGYHQGRKERRYTQPTQMVVHARGRQHSEPPTHYPASFSPHAQPVTGREYDGALVAYSNGPATPSAPPVHSDYRRTSPNPGANHTIKRKSVSPAPPPSEPRRSSIVPFGPDSYDAFNPAAAAAREDPNSRDYTNANGKIVTPDGREVDPSDHLPMDTWAPEPEPKKASQAVEVRSRPVPSGAQPMPTSGRRPLREVGRPQSMAITPPTYPEYEPPTASSTGRNRLQKKNHRMSALPAPISASSSPLGPASAHQRNSTPPRALVRASTFDYENHGPHSDNEYAVARLGHGSAPPIPAKIPLMSGGAGPALGRRSNEELALMEEMSRIDIGTGRARRHARY